MSKAMTGEVVDSHRDGHRHMRRLEARDGFTVIQSRWTDTGTKWRDIWHGPQSRADAVWDELTREGE